MVHSKKMNIVIKKILIFLAKIIDIVLSPITLTSSIWLLFIRRLGIRRMALSKYIFKSVGILPINDHYYEPLIANSKSLSMPGSLVTSKENPPPVPPRSAAKTVIISPF